MELKEVMKYLESKGSEQTRKIYRNHGALGEIYGVKVKDLKVIQKKVKKDYELSKALFETENGDAMYLAGLIADETRMTKTDLNKWVKLSKWTMTSEYAVPWVAAETKHAESLADKWIKSKKETVASSGWSTWSCIPMLKEDSELDQKKLKGLIDHVVENVHQAPNRVRYTMNGFVISVGGYVSGLTSYAMKAGKKIGKVEVNVGNTACKVPLIPDYLENMKNRNRIGKKRKTCRC